MTDLIALAERAEKIWPSITELDLHRAVIELRNCLAVALRAIAEKD